MPVINHQGHVSPTDPIYLLPSDLPQAQALNRDIFETIYYASLETSCELAKVSGPYETYEGSPVSKGVLQFDMWDVKPSSGR